MPKRYRPQEMKPNSITGESQTDTEDVASSAFLLQFLHTDAARHKSVVDNN